MSVNYRVVSKRPAGMAGVNKPKYYPVITKTEPVRMRELADICHDRNICNRGTFLSVVTELSRLIPEMLQQGRSVQLGDLGIFSLSIKGTGHDNPEEVNAHSIKSVHINYRHSPVIKRLMTDTEFKKVE